MALRDILQADSARLTRADDLGELVEFRPLGDAGQAYTVAAVVDRVGIVTDEEGDLAFKVATVFLAPVGATNGLARAPRPGDVVVLAFDEGGDLEPGRVRTLLTQDPGGFLVEVAR